MLQIAKIVWAFPNTLIGLGAGFLALLTGGKCQFRAGCVEFHGGLVTWALKRIPLTGGVMAMTLGHSIVGQDPNALATARDHERVHVRQYELWGLFFYRRIWVFLPGFGHVGATVIERTHSKWRLTRKPIPPLRLSWGTGPIERPGCLFAATARMTLPRCESFMANVDFS